ncbi:MAG: Endopolyphosphatase [Sclerophora amabilis]|nr:MAG: Endopolyphosphatase [Sclerophora amabilis]
MSRGALVPADVGDTTVISSGLNIYLALTKDEDALTGEGVYFLGPNPPLHYEFLDTDERNPDLHPDPFYRVYSSTEKKAACHRDSGEAGFYGAEISDCDSPLSLINETFSWIDTHLKDSIDFVIWTGDSARHDNDENVPRSSKQVLDLNAMVVDKFVEVFGKPDNINDTDPTNDLIMPVVPTFGNNDILPHNVFSRGPNEWTRDYAKIWNKFIPEEQRHGFERGGWFFVEVIPNKLAVYSLNTMYFFDSNAAVDGCAKKSEPGYEHMEWLRVQLQLLRERGMKAILIGHVPPARTDSKMSWDETCWQKYTLWMRQYRDVVVGSIYGHMNVDHFMLQDNNDVDILALLGESLENSERRLTLNDDFSIQSAKDYLGDLRDEWSKLPEPPSRLKRDQVNNKKTKKRNARKEKDYLDKIGGKWAERYMVSHVSPSVVPNYFPTLRVFEYNITGLGPVSTAPEPAYRAKSPKLGNGFDLADRVSQGSILNCENGCVDEEKHKKKKKHKKPKKPDFVVPDPPSRSSPPGPAYSPQTLTWLGYTQYYANLTLINNDLAASEFPQFRASGASGGKREGNTKPLKAHHKPDPKTFDYKVEYSTFNDKVYKLKDMTVRSYLELAHRIGRYEAQSGGDSTSVTDGDESSSAQDDCLIVQGEMSQHEIDARSKKHKKHRKHKKRKAKNKAWLTFISRAFVGTADVENENEEPLQHGNLSEEDFDAS